MPLTELANLLFPLCQRNDYVYICRKKSTNVENLSGQDETSGVPKGVDEENIDLTGDQNVDNLKAAGHSKDRIKLKNKN